MYIHVLRCCVLITEKTCTKLCLRTVQKFDVAKCTSSRCIAGYVVSKHSYCTDSNHNLNDIKSNSDRIAEEQLAKLLEDPEKLKLKKLLELEVDVLRHSGAKAPTKIRTRDWFALLNLTTKSQRRRQFEFMWYNEIKAENDKIKKAKKVDNTKAKLEQGAMTYGLQHNALFLRFYTKTMQRFFNSRVIPSMIFGPDIVFDLGYEAQMSYRENTNCAKQLALSISDNRVHRSPFNLYFCNANESGPIMQQLYRIIPNIYDDDYPVNFTSKSYLDLFPKDKLVYLTPHCRSNMKRYNSDKIYILGSMVDKSNPQPFSLAKAKRDGLRMEKLPLDTYLKWGTGAGKNLPINQCLQVLLDAHHSDDWHFALRHVPKRKLYMSYDMKKKGLLKTGEEQEEQEELEDRGTTDKNIQRDFKRRFHMR